MARRQHQIDFATLDGEAKAAYRERNNELRAKLRTIEPATVGLSPLAWNYVSEILMIAWSNTTTTTLTRDQRNRARRTAERLGLVRIARRYRGGKRQADAVDVDVGAIDRLVTLARNGELGNPVRPSAPKCAQVRPSAPSSGCAIFLTKELNTSTTALNAGARETVATIEKSEAVEEEVGLELELKKLVGQCRAKLRCPVKLEEALRTAIASGCTIEQLWERCKWFHSHRTHWPSQHVRGALHDGLKNATPELPAHDGWPYR